MLKPLYILRSISLFTAANVLPQISNIFLLPFTTKYLSKLDFSIYGTILAYNLLLQGVKSLGLEIHFTNSFFKNKSTWKILWGKYLGIRFIWKHFFFIIQFPFLYAFIPDSVIENRLHLIMIITFTDYLFSATNDVAARYHVISKNSKIYFLIILSGVIFSSISNYYLIAFKDFGYLGWFVSSTIYSMIIFMPNSYLIYKKLNIFPKVSFDTIFLINSLKVSLPMVPHNYSGFLLHSSDRIILDQANVNTADLGNYNISYMIINIMDRICDSIGFVLLPILNDLFSKNDLKAEKKSRDIIFIIQILYFSIIFSVSLFCHEIFMILFNDVYSKEISLMASIMVMGISLRPMYWATINKLVFMEKSSTVWKISFLSGILNVILNIIFIPQFGVFAAVLTTNFCLITASFYGFFRKEFIELQRVSYKPLFWFVLFIIFTIFSFYLQSYNLFIRVIFSLIVLTVSFNFFMKLYKKL
tara:strand:- start:919 stop:2334 length:1416 start_codon:yes stop_codon:yes gene_type:complete